jgi:hypothetical protein
VEHPWGPRAAPDKVTEGGAHLRVRSTVRERWRQWLSGIPRQRWSSKAREGIDDVLQLEEGMREVRGHLAKEKVVHGSSSPWGGMAVVAA